MQYQIAGPRIQAADAPVVVVSQLTASMVHPFSAPCLGDWCSRGRQISISERDGRLVLEMDPDTPVLQLVPLIDPGTETWPMRWAASRLNEAAPDPTDPIYVVEMPNSVSTSLFVKRPVGESMVEFMRKGSPEQSSLNGLAANVAPRHPSASKARSHSQSQSSRSSKGPSTKGLDAGVLPNVSGGSCMKNNPGSGMFLLQPQTTAGGEGREYLVSQIKRGQRESVAFKERWWAYCDRYGNGFYDPVRHETRFLEDFLEQEKRGTDKRSGSRSRSGTSSRSRSHSRRRKRRRRKASRRRKRRRRRRGDSREKKRGNKRRRSRSRSRSGSSRNSGSIDKQSAVTVAKEALLHAERIFEQAQNSAAPEVAEGVHEEEAAQNAEAALALQRAREESAHSMASWLQEAEGKLLEEKQSRLKEAEQRLDEEIAKKLKEAEEKLALEKEARVEEAMRKEASERIEKAEGRLRAAKERLVTLRGEETRPGLSKSWKGGKEPKAVEHSKRGKRTKVREASSAGSASDGNSCDPDDSESSVSEDSR